MSAAALVISIFSLALAGVAYWRSGGKEDVRRLEDQVRQELDALRAKQGELVDHASQSLAAAYDRSRSRLLAAGVRLRSLQESALEGMEVQLQRAGEQIDALAQRLEHAAHAARSATVAAARATERGLTVRVSRVQARVVLLEVKAQAVLAERAAGEGQFDRADARLTEAIELLAKARSILGEDNVYDHQLDAVRDALRHAVDSVRSRAEDSRRRIDQVLADADRVVNTLESDEIEAASEGATPASPTS